MENSNENAHLNIETVTPDTEKEGQPNDQKHNHRVENEGDKDSGEKPTADQAEATVEKKPSAVYEKTGKENLSDESNLEEEAHETEDKDDAEVDNETPKTEESENKDDAGADIETVAP